MKVARLTRSLVALWCLTAAIPCNAAPEPPIEARDLAGVWKVFTSRGQVGLCKAATVDPVGRTRVGRVTTRSGKARIEPAEDGSWRIKRLRLDGSPESPVRRWTAEVRADGSVVSSLRSQAVCGSDPPRHYELELRGKITEKKRLRIELRGTDVVCPDMGCSFKVTHVLTRETTERRSNE